MTPTEEDTERARTTDQPETGRVVLGCWQDSYSRYSVSRIPTTIIKTGQSLLNTFRQVVSISDRLLVSAMPMPVFEKLRCSD